MLDGALEVGGTPSVFAFVDMVVWMEDEILACLESRPPLYGRREAESRELAARHSKTQDCGMEEKNHSAAIPRWWV